MGRDIRKNKQRCYTILRQIGGRKAMAKTKMKESDLYLNCDSCGEKIQLGQSFRYETMGYRPYCADFDCINGIATEGASLETCWWGCDDDLQIEWGV